MEGKNCIFAQLHETNSLFQEILEKKNGLGERRCGFWTQSVLVMVAW